MKKLILLIACLFSLLSISEGKAQEFFDTSDAEKFFSLGGRIGFNTSNRTFPSAFYVNNIFTAWGTGFNAGITADLNIKDYLSIQPGFFYESRSSNLISVSDYNAILGQGEKTYYEKDHLRGYYFTIPIMGIVNFNLAKRIRWSVEFGPYLQFCLKQTGQNNLKIIYPETTGNTFAHYVAKPKNFDFGFKMGTGLKFYNKYYFGIHYMAGVCNAWSVPSGGNNRSWMFTIGYDFFRP